MFNEQLYNVNIHCIKELGLRKRQITLSDNAPNSSISVGNVETIIQECLWLKKGCAYGVPKMLTFD
jgi:hypothetical protein